MSLRQGLMALFREFLRMILQTLQDAPVPRLNPRTKPLEIVPAGEFVSFRILPANDPLPRNLPADRRQLFQARFDTLPARFPGQSLRTQPLDLRIAFDLRHLPGMDIGRTGAVRRSRIDRRMVIRCGDGIDRCRFGKTTG